jgi:DNA/RNA-binding protein KIN17
MKILSNNSESLHPIYLSVFLAAYSWNSCLSESHVRQILSDNPQKYISQYTEDFKREFLQLLRTGHREKPVHLNTFYQSYIADKHHVHLNATRFSSLTEFAKYLGREGICRVTEEEGKGVFIAWIDNSPDALRRKDAVQKRKRLDEDGEHRDQLEIQAQTERAWEGKTDANEQKEDAAAGTVPVQPFKLDFSGLSKPGPAAPVIAPQSKPKNVFKSVKRQPRPHSTPQGTSKGDGKGEPVRDFGSSGKKKIKTSET